MVSSSMPSSTSRDRSTELAECGFKIEEVTQLDGTITRVQVPLKVVEYARAQVQEYVIIDRRTYRNQVLETVRKH